MQPYQEATEEIVRQGELPLKIAKNIGSGLGAGALTTAAGNVLSLVNRFVPENLAIKGLSKLDPRYGVFIDKALKGGKSFDEVREFLTGKAEEVQETEKLPKESRNIIEQYSPELHQFMIGEIKKGRTPIQAGALAQNDKRFSDVIRKLSKDHKTPWSQILEGIYGANESAIPSQQGMPESQVQQPGKGQQALMEILQRINQRIGS